MQAALAALLEAHEYVRDLDGSIWEFAIEMAALRRLGVSTSDLRWLIGRGLVDHAVETTRAGDVLRCFRKPPRPMFSKRSCFILTSSGESLARETGKSGQPAAAGNCIAHQQAPRVVMVAPTVCLIPKWERDRQELKVGSIVVKRFKLPAAEQVTILAAFEDSAWSQRIANPLPSGPYHANWRPLQAAIDALNRNQLRPLVQFASDSTGEGVLWKLAVVPGMGGE